MFVVVRLVYDTETLIVPEKFLYSEDNNKSIYCYYNKNFLVHRPPVSSIKILYSKTFSEMDPHVYRVYMKKKFGKLANRMFYLL